MTTPPSHTPSFTGTILVGRHDLPQPTLALVQADLEAAANDQGLLSSASKSVVVEGRPNRALVDRAVEIGQRAAVGSVAAIGPGALLDAAKLVALELSSDGVGSVDLAFVPCGPEPYRAVARFAVIDSEGERPTIVDPRFAAALVLVVPGLLASQPPEQPAVHALDTAVHCIESLLSTRAHPYAGLLASSALRTVAGASKRIGEDPEEARTALVLASFLAVEAFATTRLGLAHALASPLGTELGMTHDTINGVLGVPLIDFWGSDVPGFQAVAAALGVQPENGAVSEVLDQIRVRAQLPATLAAHGVPWPSVERVLPIAARSSGIPVLPRPLDPTSIHNFALRSWGGAVSEEVVHVERV